MTTTYFYLRPTYLLPKRLIYVRVRGPYAEAARVAWAQMFDWLDEHNLHSDEGKGYGLVLDDPRQVPAEQCRYDACIEIPVQWHDQVPPGVPEQRLPGGAYLRQCHTGSHDALREGFALVRETFVPSHGILLDCARPLIEIYRDDPREIPSEKLRTDLCLPIVTEVTPGHEMATLD